MAKKFSTTKLPEKTQERGLSEAEITNLLDKDFKIKIINILMEVQKNSQELRNEFW